MMDQIIAAFNAPATYPTWQLILSMILAALGGYLSFTYSSVMERWAKKLGWMFNIIWLIAWFAILMSESMFGGLMYISIMSFISGAAVVKIFDWAWKK